MEDNIPQTSRRYMQDNISANGLVHGKDSLLLIIKARWDLPQDIREYLQLAMREQMPWDINNRGYLLTVNHTT